MFSQRQFQTTYFFPSVSEDTGTRVYNNNNNNNQSNKQNFCCSFQKIDEEKEKKNINTGNCRTFCVTCKCKKSFFQTHLFIDILLINIDNL